MATVVGVEFCRVKSHVESIIDWEEFKLMSIEYLGVVNELNDQLNMPITMTIDDILDRLVIMGLNVILRNLMHKSKVDNIIPPRGQVLVECMGLSTIDDVAYVKEHLFRNDIELLVFVEDWSADDILRIEEAATSSGVILVQSTKIQHQPTVNYISNRDKIRNLKIKTDMCKGYVVKLNSNKEAAREAAEKAEREAAETTDMKDKGSYFYHLMQKENVLTRSRMMVKRLELELTELKGALAELLQSGYRGGQEIIEARSTIAEVEQYGALY